MANQISFNSELLMSLVEGNPVLWDKTLPKYKNRTVTKNAWNHILSILVPEYENLEEQEKYNLGKIVVQKWTHIRDSYFKNYRKIQEQKITKCAKTTKPYIYNKNLSFLRKITYPPPSQTTDEDSDDQDDSAHENSKASPVEHHPEKSSKVSSKRVSCIKKRSARNKMTPIDEKMKKFIGPFSQESKPINRHISFLTGLLPTLDNFDEDEVLEFQVGVLKLLKSIKNSRQSHIVNSYSLNSPSTSRELVEFSSIPNPIKIENE